MGISLKGILRSVAPTIAGALPGPLGSMAKKVVTDLLGIKDTSSEEAIEEALAKANPELLLKLKQADMDFQVKMEQLGIDLAKLSFEDTASARQMQMTIKSRTPAILSGVVTGGWVAITTFILLHTVPEANKDIIMRTLGTMDMALALVLGFWFGSSAGSAKKDATIHELSR